MIMHGDRKGENNRGWIDWKINGVCRLQRGETDQIKAWVEKSAPGTLQNLSHRNKFQSFTAMV